MEAKQEFAGPHNVPMWMRMAEAAVVMADTGIKPRSKLLGHARYAVRSVPARVPGKGPAMTRHGDVAADDASDDCTSV